MDGVIAAFRGTTIYRGIKFFFAAILFVGGLLGLIGIGADVRAWRDWMGGIDSWVPYLVAYSALLGVGLALLGTEIVAFRNRRTWTPSAEFGQVAESSERQVQAKGEPRSASVSGAVSPPVSGAKTDQPLSDLLQKRLDEGIRLRNNIPAVPGMGNLTRPETTQPDVEIWIRRTQRMPHGEPELLGGFNYKPCGALLDGLLPAQSLMPKYKKTLDQRIANLGGVITDLRNQDR